MENNNFKNFDFTMPAFPNILPDSAKYVKVLEDADILYIEKEFENYVKACVSYSRERYKNEDTFLLLGFGCVSGKHTDLSVEKCNLPSQFSQNDNASDYFNSLSVFYKIIYSGSKCSGEVYISLCAKNIIKFADGSIIWLGFEIKDIEI